MCFTILFDFLTIYFSHDPNFSLSSPLVNMQTGDAAALHTTHHSSGLDVSDPDILNGWADVRNDCTGFSGT